MKLESFQSGKLRKQYQYASFTPTSINLEWTWGDAAINLLLERATKALSELNAYSMVVPEVDLFIQMHITKEANTSSRIEGTQTNMDEAVMDIENVAPEKRDDWQEVQNYIQAMNDAIAELNRLPLSNRLLKTTHGILMQGVRGEHKSPGEYRTTQNWIGGTSLADAVFIPPHQDEVAELMSDLEKFWHNDGIAVPHLIRVALSHYQFETIHPFCDGNGRIGRLLITLYLVSTKFLHRPCLYLSAYLEKHKGAYYDALTTVRASHNIIHWIKFFLLAVAETAENGIQTFRQILELKHQVDQKLIKLGRRTEIAHRLMNLLYRRPVITSPQAVAALGVTQKTAIDLIGKLAELGILREITGYKKNRIFIFHEYLALFTS